jgi:hypothetical protein
MFRCPLPLTLVVLSALTAKPAIAQGMPPRSPAWRHSGTTEPLAVQWSMPVSRLTRHVPSWSRTDIALAGGFLAMLWVDAAQTRSLARQNWAGFYETNPILGPKPSVSRINTYTAAAAITTLGVAAILPPRARRWWLAGAFAVETSTVIYTTTQLGIALRVR